MRSSGPAPPYGRKAAGAALTGLNALARITKRRSDLVAALNETLRRDGFMKAYAAIQPRWLRRAASPEENRAGRDLAGARVNCRAR